jgi:serine/threonine protein kinase
VLIDDEERAVLADFGFARIAQISNWSDPGGTPAYMAPELFKADRSRSQQLENAIDVFALGTLIHEVLSCCVLGFRSA